MHKTVLSLIPIALSASILGNAGVPGAARESTNIQRIEMVAESYSFMPRRIVVKAGVPVVLIIEKNGLIPHDFIIDDPDSGLSMRRKLGDSTIIRFTPMKRGTFEFYCGKDLPFFKSHKEKGMHGILEVR